MSRSAKFRICVAAALLKTSCAGISVASGLPTVSVWDSVTLPPESGRVQHLFFGDESRLLVVADDDNSKNSFEKIYRVRIASSSTNVKRVAGDFIVDEGSVGRLVEGFLLPVLRIGARHRKIPGALDVNSLEFKHSEPFFHDKEIEPFYFYHDLYGNRYFSHQDKDFYIKNSKGKIFSLASPVNLVRPAIKNPAVVPCNEEYFLSFINEGFEFRSLISGRLVNVFSPHSYLGTSPCSAESDYIFRYENNQSGNSVDLIRQNITSGRISSAIEYEETDAIRASASGRWGITIHSDGAVHVWNLAQPLKEPYLIFDHPDDVIAAIFSPNENILVTQDLSGGVILHDLQTRKSLVSLSSLSGLPIVFNNSGDQMAFVSHPNEITVLQFGSRLSLKDDWERFISDCPSDADALALRLKAFKRRQGSRLNSMTEDELNMLIYKDSKESELFEIFFPYLFPENTPFSGFFQSCYVFLYDFHKRLIEDNVVEVAELKAWNSCLLSNYRYIPESAKTFNQCVNKSLTSPLEGNFHGEEPLAR